MHLIAIESKFYALSRFGWLISLRKSTISKPKFIFLRATWDMNKETIGSNDDRLNSILNWREPWSVAEASSRLSSLMFYEHQALWLKRLAFPLFMMVKAGTFKWAKAESHAWHDILLLMRRAIKNAIFNQDHPLLLLVDTSAVETAGFVIQWSPVTNLLRVLKAKSHLLTTPKRRISPVHRESQGTHYVMEDPDHTSSRPDINTTSCSSMPPPFIT